ncbi:MAG: DUF2723 domain-containing protein [Sedimentisphaerales bacterium]|nr:DUF2723 domain-containing protein [Sedimentisphaerales bacterium]
MKMPLVRDYFLVLAAAILLYALTCAPGALWQDSGMYQYRIWKADLRGGLGLALAHPLYILLGHGAKIIPCGEYGYRINLISSLAAAFTVANVFLFLCRWLGSRLPAILGCVTLALSWTFWQHACIAEVYALYTALFTTELLLLLQYIKSDRPVYAILLAFVNGLAVSTHMWAVIPLAVYILYLTVQVFRRKFRVIPIILMLTAWIAGALPYVWLILERWSHSGDFGGTLHSACFGDHWSGAVLNTSLSRRIVLENLLFVLLSFPTPNIILSFLGVAALMRRTVESPLSFLVLLLLGMFFLFSFRYTVPDRYAFFLPFYCLFAICAGLGLHVLFQRFALSVRTGFILFSLALLPIPVYAVAYRAARQMKMDLGMRREIPYRDEYRYFLCPWQRANDGPMRFAREGLLAMERDAILLADGTTVYTLWYQQEIHTLRPDVRIVSHHGDYQSPLPYPDQDQFEEWFRLWPVYVVSPVPGYCPRYILTGEYEFVPAGSVYRVQPIKSVIESEGTL